MSFRPRFARQAAAFVVLLLSPTLAPAQDTYLYTTIAGKAGEPGNGDGPGTDARFASPTHVAVDNSGNIFVVDRGSATIRKVSPTGAVTTIAGRPLTFGTSDGPASSARFGASLTGIAVDSNGTLFVSDTSNATVRRISSEGFVTTFAGAAGSPGYVNGYGGNARFSSPQGLCTDAMGEVIVADLGNETIRRLSTLPMVTTVAGAPWWRSTITPFTPGSTLVPSPIIPGSITPGLPPEPVDGTATTARFFSAMDVTVDTAGNLYVIDQTFAGGGAVRKITLQGVVTTIAGTLRAVSGGLDDGTGADARFSAPSGIVVDSEGTLFIADTRNHRIRRVSAGGVVTTIGGHGTPDPFNPSAGSGSADGVGTAALFNAPIGLAVDKDGNVYIADTGNHTIRKQTRITLAQITSQPRGRSANVGETISLTVSTASVAPVSYQWSRDGTTIGGATTAILTLPNIQIGQGGDFSVTVTNPAGSVTSAVATVSVGDAPTVSAQPSALSVLGGEAITLRVTATGAPAPTFQWRKDGEPIPGATNAILTVVNAQAGDAGAYTVFVSNAAGSVTSAAAAVTVNTSRIVNLSIRSGLAPGAPLLTVGFVVSGNGKSLLVRGVGPTLAQFGLPNALADPRIALFAGASATVSNDNWGTAANAAEISAAAAQNGAFALGAGSSDAAVLGTFEGGSYSAQITGPANASGIVLVELYDANATTASRLVNVSTRAQVGTGDNILVAGFVVAGNARKTLLIRAVGPTLAAFGVTGTLADPRLEIIGSGGAAPVAANDNWGGTAALAAAFAAQGAFPLAAPDSRDAALLVTLDPGSYSAQVSGVGATTGEALIEIYEVP